VGPRLLMAFFLFMAGSVATTVLLLSLYDTGFLVVFPAEEHHIELLSLFLAAATLVIAAVTLVLALGAVVGYSYMKDAAAQSGKDAGARAAGDHLAPFTRRLDAALTAMEAGAADRTDDLKNALSERP
jgi:hypothetical protein